MPSVTYSPYPGPNNRNSGDTYVNGGVDTNQVDSTLLRFGDESKAANYDTTFLAFSTAIPANATVVSAKLDFVAESTQTGTVIASVHGLTPGDWSVLKSTDVTNTTYGIRCSILDTASAALATGASTNAEQLSIRDDWGATSQGQVLTLASAGNGTLGSVKMHIGRTGSDSSALVWLEIWSVSGAAGGYAENVLLASSDNVLFDDVQPSVNEVTFTYSGSQQISVSSSQILLLKVRHSSILDGTTRNLRLTGDSTFDASTNNSIRYGSFAAFSTLLYTRQQDLTAIVELSPKTDVTANDMTSGVAYSWGSAAYSPSVSTDGIATAVQNCVSHASYSGIVGIGIRGATGSTDGKFRTLRSSDYSGETGPQLTVEYLVDSFVQSTTTAVTAVSSTINAGAAIAAAARLGAAADAVIGSEAAVAASISSSVAVSGAISVN